MSYYKMPNTTDSSLPTKELGPDPQKHRLFNGEYELESQRPPSHSPGLQHTESMQSVTIDPETGEPLERQLWQPGFWLRLPRLAIGCLVGVVGCTVAALVILAVSDGENIEDWHSGFTPSVYLSILSAFGNLLLALAFTRGMIISFWRKALDGCELVDLHYQWLSGYSCLSAIADLAKGRSRFTSIACIITTLSVIRGPLYQRASFVRGDSVVHANGTVAVHIAQQLPVGYTGVSEMTRAGAGQTSRLNTNFTSVMKAYSKRDDIFTDHSDCGDMCNTTIRGFGFGINCSTTMQENEYSINGSSTSWPVFVSTVEDLWLDGSSPYMPYSAGLRLNASFATEASKWDSDTEMVNVKLASHVCDLTPGIVPYNVALSNGTVTLSNNDDLNSSLITHIPGTGPDRTGGNTTIGGFQYAGSYLLDSSAKYNFAGAVSSFRLEGSLANQYLSNTTSTDLFFTDPMPEMVSTVREIAFRAALQVAAENPSWPNSTQNATYEGTRTVTRYHTEWADGLAATGLTFIGLVAVAATLWGWWDIGRAVSLSPLEMARAFDAPSLQGTSGNSKVEDLVKGVKRTGRKVRYGVVDRGSGDGSGQLLLGDAERVSRPKPGQHY